MVCQHPGHVAPPTNALGPLGCFKRCHCIGVLAAPPACLACMVPLRLGLQPVSSFTAKRQLVGGLARQTGPTMGRFVRWQQLAVGMWHVWGVHTGTCIVGCSLKQPARPPTRHTPIFRLFRKKAGFFGALQAITQKTPPGGAGFFCVAARMQIIGRTNAKLQKCISTQNTRFGLFWAKKGIHEEPNSVGCRRGALNGAHGWCPLPPRWGVT